MVCIAAWPFAHNDFEPRPQLLPASGLPSTCSQRPFTTVHSVEQWVRAGPHIWHQQCLISTVSSVFCAPSPSASEPAQPARAPDAATPAKVAAAATNVRRDKLSLFVMVSSYRFVSSRFRIARHAIRLRARRLVMRRSDWAHRFVARRAGCLHCLVTRYSACSHRFVVRYAARPRRLVIRRQGCPYRFVVRYAGVHAATLRDSPNYL